MIYGTPIVTRADDQTDRIGVRTLLLQQTWEASRSDLSQAEIDAEKPGIPAVPGGVLLIGEQTRPFGGSYKTLWTFEGINGDGKSVTFKDRTNSLDYGFEPGMAQVSIKLLSKFQALLTKYGGFLDPDSGNVIWPPTLPTGNTSSSGLSAARQDATKTNPMFGIEDWFRLDGTYRFRYAATQMSNSLFDGVEFISHSLPGQPPHFEGRNWLKAAPLVRRRGTIFDITEYYWLSGPGGWPSPIYDFEVWSSL